MPPHTISPTPSSHGLGISYSTLSPPPAPIDGPSRQHGFTGMGMGPRPSPSRSNPSPCRLRPPLPFPGPSSTRVEPPSPSRIGPLGARPQNLYQRSLALRSAHNHPGSANGYASFSVLPSSPAPIPPAGPRAYNTVMNRAPAAPPSDSSCGTDETERIRPRQPQEDRSPSRKGSLASVSTASTNILHRARSSELLRKFSKTGSAEHGRYLPLTGEEEGGNDELDVPEPTSTLVHASPASPLLRHPRSSTITVTPAESKVVRPQHSQSIVPCENAERVVPSFPFPPNHPPRTLSTQSDPMASHRPLPRPMPRSLSQPFSLQPVPEMDAESRRPSFAPSMAQSQSGKRMSDLSTGIHSKNAVLLSAEAGGMMLAFSPSGDGVWREGELICGAATGLIPTPQSVPIHRLSDARSQEGEDETELRAPPWSDSTTNHPSDRPGPLGHRGRSLSDGANILARQGTLFHPGSSHKRASAELSLMLGGQRSRRVSGNKLLPPPELEGWQASGGEGADKVKLEAAKKRKARVEVDVVLERECVVEGGEVRGRMEVRVTGGKRGEGLRIGAGKIRVVGFEDISPTSRHIFYHQPHSLPVFADTPHPSARSTLFASPPDSEGYRLAAEGVHAIPFRLRLPFGGGAKGSFNSADGKGPAVRYVVVGSVKIHVPSTRKRSIAHFYRSVVVLPYLNPSVVLAPSQECIEASVEKGLGWSLGGGKGRVELSVAVGRRIWVSGQRAWCEVRIRNDSSRKIKTLQLALLQTVQVFNPAPLLSTGEEARTPDADACQTQTQRKKISEEVLEADFGSHGAGRVTGKGWWTGVEPGENGNWDLSLLIPNGLLSIRRTRLIEVQYNLRVTVNGSIYADLPIQLINFLSIDPPPMPGDGLRNPVRNMIREVIPAQNHRNTVYAQRPMVVRTRSGESAASGIGSESHPARASSTTLHIDALLQAGRARAETQPPGQIVPVAATSRPVSMVSTYTLEPRASVKRGPSLAVPRRPGGPGRLMSYLSQRESEPSEPSVDSHDDAHEDFLATRRAQGRQRSLAAIHRAMDREQEAIMHDDEGSLDPGREVEEGEFKPVGTPDEETYDLVGDTPSLNGRTPEERTHSRAGTLDSRTKEGVYDGIAGSAESHEARSDNNHRQLEATEPEYTSSYEDLRSDSLSPIMEHRDDVGDDTILEELASDELLNSPMPGESGGYDYSDEVEDGDDLEARRKSHILTSLPRVLPQLDVATGLNLHNLPGDRAEHIRNTRSINGSVAASFVSEVESEVRQVYQAVKRNVSVRLPPAVVPLPHRESREPSLSPSNKRLDLSNVYVPRSGSTPNAFRAPEQDRPSSLASEDFLRRERGPRRGSAPSPHDLPGRKGSVPTVPSPLRPNDDGNPTKRLVFPYTDPAYPLRAPRDSFSPDEAPMSPGLSPRSAQPGQLHATGPTAESSQRQPSGSSQLRHQIQAERLRTPSPEGSEHGEESGPPGLAPSVASDSASSEGHRLESPPAVQDLPRSSFSLSRPTASTYSGNEALRLTGSSKSRPEPWHTSPAQPLAPQPIASTPGPATRSLSPLAADSRSSSSPSSPSSTHSILPSVRTKIAQLESRDEALRKFSVSGAFSSSQSYPSTTASPPGPGKRKSYTSALAPRPVRSLSDDSADVHSDRLGGTTYVSRRGYGERLSSGFEGYSSALRRTESSSTTGTNGTMSHERATSRDGNHGTTPNATYGMDGGFQQGGDRHGNSRPGTGPHAGPGAYLLGRGEYPRATEYDYGSVNGQSFRSLLGPTLGSEGARGYTGRELGESPNRKELSGGHGEWSGGGRNWQGLVAEADDSEGLL